MHAGSQRSRFDGYARTSYISATCGISLQRATYRVLDRKWNASRYAMRLTRDSICFWFCRVLIGGEAINSSAVYVSLSSRL
ncbi:hypothetical protein PUN28_015370 [Cardiocondyla obscurior]|uniref:Uncharacterized protein n=1 Tax=Cardiocondyla obscurior TaxID=286306 RepID=A0AAW2ESM4_9HYME